MYPSSFPGGGGGGRVKCNHCYLSSYFIVVQVKSRPRIVPVFQDVDKATRLLLSKPDVISTSAPLPVTVSASLFLHGASTSGYFTLSALERDLVDDSRCTNSVDKRCLTSGCEKMARQRSVRLSFLWQILCAERINFFTSHPLIWTSKENLYCLQPVDYYNVWKSTKGRKKFKLWCRMQLNDNVKWFSRSKYIFCQDT